jgi:hypothetical protein
MLNLHRYRLLSRADICEKLDAAGADVEQLLWAVVDQ